MYRDVDETTRANLQASPNQPVQSHGAMGGAGAVVPSPSTGFRFVPPLNPSATTQQGQAQQQFMFGSATGTGMQSTPATTLAGQFLSHSEG